MKTAHLISAIIALTAPAAILCYDGIVAVLFGTNTTISSVVREWADVWHELPYFVLSLFLFLWLHLFDPCKFHNPPGPQAGVIEGGPTRTLAA